MPQIAHIQIRSLAIEMAGELFDEMMKDNMIWAEWQAAYPALDRQAVEARFIEMLWPLLVGRARATLAGMLHGQAETSLNNDVATALIDDNQFRRARERAIRRWRHKYGLDVQQTRTGRLP